MDKDYKLLLLLVKEQINEPDFLESVLSAISWSHHLILLDKEPHLVKRLWYMHHCIENGISRNILPIHIESGLFELNE